MYPKSQSLTLSRRRENQGRGNYEIQDSLGPGLKHFVKQD